MMIAPWEHSVPFLPKYFQRNMLFLKRDRLLQTVKLEIEENKGLVTCKL